MNLEKEIQTEIEECIKREYDARRKKDWLYNREMLGRRGALEWVLEKLRTLNKGGG